MYRTFAVVFLLFLSIPFLYAPDTASVKIVFTQDSFVKPSPIPFSVETTGSGTLVVEGFNVINGAVVLPTTTTDFRGPNNTFNFPVPTTSLNEGSYKFRAIITETNPPNSDSIQGNNFDEQTVVLVSTTVSVPEFPPILLILIVFGVLFLIKRN
ncbi:MAG TPA: hypothetical protein VFF13_02660 [archaeon]|nr:hypothetical protein [archaeon]